MGKISFFYEETNFTLPNANKIKAWLKTVITEEGFELDAINYIFCSDEYLHTLNLQYLDHDTFTDIITFDYTQENCLEGDIYISVDRVKDNAIQLTIPFHEEINRVMAHGLLHMMGFRDKSSTEKKQMRSKEDSCLSLLTINE